MNTLPLPACRSFPFIAVFAVVILGCVFAVWLFPVVTTGHGDSKKTQARNDAAQIALAISAYLSEYGHLPTTSQADVIANANTGELMDILSPPSPDTFPLNPRGIDFLEIPNAQNGHNGRRNGKGPYLDPWGQAYLISLDGDGDGLVKGPDGPGGAVEIQKRILVWSKGDPARLADFANPVKWIKSWN